MRSLHVLLGLFAIGLTIRCTPDFDELQQGGGGRRNDGGGGNNEGGEDPTGGNSPKGGATFGGGPTNPGGEGGLGGGGQGGLPQGGAAGEGGAPFAGAGQGGGGQGGSAGDYAGGAGGGADDLVLPCEDGCAHLYVPFSKTQTYKTQFYTLDFGQMFKDFTGAEVSARIRVVGLAQSTEIIQLYSSDDAYHFFGGPGTALSALTEGGTISMQPVTGPDPNGATFDADKVRSFGIQISTNAADPKPIHVIVEEITITGTTEPIGPYAFTENVHGMYANDFQPVEGSTITWIPPYP